MARPIKWRKIENLPNVTDFQPIGIDTNDFVKNILLLEEFEAIRLKDLEGLEQEECAIKMEVSRPTFQRILLSAREKIADSLVNGKGLSISGGTYTRNICNVRCTNCGKTWRDSYENIETIKAGIYNCPDCDSKKVVCIENNHGRFCHGNCRRNARKIR